MKYLLLFSLLILGCTTFAAKRVVVSVTTGKSNDFDSLVYSKNRPLQIGDFKGSQSSHPIVGASIHCGISVSSQHRASDSTIYLDVFVTPVFIKSMSYYHLENQNFAGYNTLEHAQLLFDIAAVKGCELMTAIKDHTFSPEHFEDELKELEDKYQQENYTDRKALYDDTRRGTYRYAEMEWKHKISKQLEGQSCY